MSIDRTSKSVIAEIGDHTIELVRLFEGRHYAESASTAELIAALADAEGLTEIAAHATTLRLTLGDAQGTTLEAAESGLLGLVEEVAHASAALEP